MPWRKTWLPSKRVDVPDRVKAEVEAEAAALLDEHLRPRYVKRPRGKPRNIYAAELFTKWRGRHFTFVARYACPQRWAAGRSFDRGFARIGYEAGGTFELGYLRHNDKWWTVHTGLTLKKAIQQIRDCGTFHALGES